MFTEDIIAALHRPDALGSPAFGLVNGMLWPPQEPTTGPRPGAPTVTSVVGAGVSGTAAKLSINGYADF